MRHAPVIAGVVPGSFRLKQILPPKGGSYRIQRGVRGSRFEEPEPTILDHRSSIIDRAVFDGAMARR